VDLPRDRVYDLNAVRHLKFRVKSVHELTAVVYDLSAMITAFKSWIAWERSLRFKYSATPDTGLWSDHIGRLRGFYARKAFPDKLRLVRF
jgi:hypothetical protein